MTTEMFLSVEMNKKNTTTSTDKKVQGPLIEKDATDTGRIKQNWKDTHKPISTSNNQRGTRG